MDKGVTTQPNLKFNRHCAEDTHSVIVTFSVLHLYIGIVFHLQMVRYIIQEIFYTRNFHNFDIFNYVYVETLEQRRVKSDLVLYYETINNIMQINAEAPFRYVATQRVHNRLNFTWYCRTKKS